jgi:quinol monooxygenase YgiN
VAEHASVVRVTHFQPASGKRQELTAALQSMADAIRSAEGCFGVQVCAVRELPDVVAIISRWSDQGSLDRVLQGSAVDMSKVESLVSSPPASEHLTPV